MLKLKKLFFKKKKMAGGRDKKATAVPTLDLEEEASKTPKAVMDRAKKVILAGGKRGNGSFL